MVKQDLRRFAPFGLYLAGLAIIAAVGLYIVQQSFTLPIQISLAVIVIGLALYVLLDPAGARAALTGRQARYGSNALVLTLAFLGILIVVNYLVYQNTRRWDLTEDQTNTLAPETVQALETLQTKVTAEAYYTSRFPLGSTKDLLENYKLNGKGNFDYVVIDPEQDPIKANDAKITRDGTIVLRAEDRMEQVSYANEQEMTAALIRLANPGERAVYFLTGHGEHDINGTEDTAYSKIKSALEAKNYTVDVLNLLSTASVPENAQAVIVAGAMKPLSDQEVAALKAYLDNGGSLVYLAEPRAVTQFGDAADPMAAYIEQSWGILLNDDVVVDLTNQQQPLFAVATQFGQHAITQKMYTYAVVLPIARSIQAAQAPVEGVTITDLGSTTQNAWGETDIESLQNQSVTMDQGSDLVGPLTLAQAAVNSTSQARLVVIGDSDFASDQFYTAYGNTDFLLNSIDWAAEQENLISLTPKQSTERFLLIPQGYSMGLILLGSVFLLPGIVVITGITVFIQRRRRG